MRLQILFASTALALGSSCVTIPNYRACTVAALIEVGGDCAMSNTLLKTKITAAELVYMLEPQPERPDPDHPGQMLPKRAGAVIIEAAEYKRMKDAVELACRMLGNKCTYEGVAK